MKELLKKLIQAQTTADKGELAAAEVISAEFKRAGIDSQIDVWDGNRANIISHIKSAAGKPALLFGCHLDVVGPGDAVWKYPAFDAVESEGRIYGRGSTDMKGGIASVIEAICRLMRSGIQLQGDIIFFAAAGEETDSCGVERFIRNRTRLPELTGVIIPEPTDFSIVTAHRGLLWLEVITKGKAAHSSAPELGVNAINSMRSFLNELEEHHFVGEFHEMLGRCSISINTIAAGNELNVVPDRCTAAIDIRTVPGQNHRYIIAEIEKIFAKLRANNPEFEAEVRMLRQSQPLETDRHCTFVKDFCFCLGTQETKSVGFTTDGPSFVCLGAPIVIFGPGKPEICHKPDEYIEIDDVEKAVDYYKKLILQFLG
jgi:succinyl-diaminopimelate desuccinylase